MRRLAVLLLLFTVSLLSAAPRRPSPTRPPSVAPQALPHQMAQFLRSLSADGGRQVTFKATAVGTRFYFEESGGVTVYRFERGNYVREEFLRGATLPNAVKKYALLR
jgi:hypothetical protein